MGGGSTCILGVSEFGDPNALPDQAGGDPGLDSRGNFRGRGRADQEYREHLNLQFMGTIHALGRWASGVPARPRRGGRGAVKCNGRGQRHPSFALMALELGLGWKFIQQPQNGDGSQRKHLMCLAWVGGGGGGKQAKKKTAKNCWCLSVLGVHVCASLSSTQWQGSTRCKDTGTTITWKPIVMRSTPHRVAQSNSTEHASRNESVGRAHYGRNQTSLSSWNVSKCIKGPCFGCERD